LSEEETLRRLDGMLFEPFIIQAWADTAPGIPRMGLEGQFHDVRIIFLIREPGVAQFVQLYVKTLEGLRFVPIEEFGPAPFAIVDPIADWIAHQFPFGVFCVDVMRDASGTWFLTEINDQIGLTANFEHAQEVEGLHHLMRAVIGAMKRLCSERGIL
jgi:hypothetical protein